MVEQNDPLDTVLKAVADPVRRRLLQELSNGPKTVSELAAPLEMSFAGASKHLGILIKADLVTQQKQGRERLCSLNARPLQELQGWLDHYTTFWTGRLDALEQALWEDME
jgi:DNA-binding transcriptional ArsR family regulator